MPYTAISTRFGSLSSPLEGRPSPCPRPWTCRCPGVRPAWRRRRPVRRARARRACPVSRRASARAASRSPVPLRRRRLYCLQTGADAAVSLHAPGDLDPQEPELSPRSARPACGPDRPRGRRADGHVPHLLGHGDITVADQAIGSLAGIKEEPPAGGAMAPAPVAMAGPPRRRQAKRSRFPWVPWQRGTGPPASASGSPCGANCSTTRSRRYA